jgi:hypothetical protein
MYAEESTVGQAACVRAYFDGLLVQSERLQYESSALSG